MEKRRKKDSASKNVLKNNMFLIKLCFKAAPLYFTLFILNVIRGDLVIFLEFTFGLNFILECAEFGRSFSYALAYLVGLFLFVVLGMLFDSWFNENYRMRKLPYVKKCLKEKLYRKAEQVDFECYDNPQYYNNLILAVSESDKQIDRVFTLMNKLVSSVTTFILTGVFFIVEDVVSFAFILAIFVFSFIMNQIYNKLNFKIYIQKNQHERKRQYINRVFYLADYAKEIRLNTEVSGILLGDFEKTNKEMYDIETDNAAKRFGLDFMKEYVCNTLIHDVIYMIYLLYRAMIVKAISYSNVVVLFKASTKVRNSMQTFSTIYPFAMETSLFVDKIEEFLNTEKKVVSTQNRSVEKKLNRLELKHVYFSYSGDENYVLKDINITIDESNKVALVGFNGAGKTTLVKLIMRLYDVTKGEILLNGINIKEYEVEEYRSKIGVVFQDYNIYAATLLENVQLDIVDESKKEIAQKALEKSGFPMERFPRGLDTQLTTEFEKEGVNLSKGESQKVAVGRIFYNENPVLILDEPSSALDPISEYDLNKSMFKLATNKMIIFISHRLSTTRFSDHIYVLDQGEIVEHGTHDELLGNAKVYSEMWNAQAGHYIND